MERSTLGSFNDVGQVERCRQSPRPLPNPQRNSCLNEFRILPIDLLCGSAVPATAELKVVPVHAASKIDAHDWAASSFRFALARRHGSVTRSRIGVAADRRSSAATWCDGRMCVYRCVVSSRWCPIASFRWARAARTSAPAGVDNGFRGRTSRCCQTSRAPDRRVLSESGACPSRSDSSASIVAIV
jgi:hypothetical protein